MQRQVDSILPEHPIHFPEERICALAARHGHRAPFGERLSPGQRVQKLPFKQAQQAHAVFDLAKLLIRLIRRQRHARLEVPFVRQKRKGRSLLRSGSGGKGLDPLDHAKRRLRRIRLQLRQAFAKARQSDRNERNGLRGRVQAVQIGERPVQHLAVIDARTAHDLRMEAQPRLGKAREPLHEPARRAVAHHLCAHLRIRGMDGDIQRADAPAEDALQLLLRNVRQRHIIAHDEREAPIIVLDKQAGAHIARHLIDKAKDAAVGAGAHFAHQAGGKRQTERLAFPLADGNRPLFAPIAEQRNAQQSGRGQVFIIDKVQHRLAVDREQILPLPHTGTRCGRIGLHPNDSLLFISTIIHMFAV